MKRLVGLEIGLLIASCSGPSGVGPGAGNGASNRGAASQQDAAPLGVSSSPRDAATPASAQGGTSGGSGGSAARPATDAATGKPTPDAALGALPTDASHPDAGSDASTAPATPPVLRTFVFVGGYTNSVRRYALDRQSGALSELGASVDLGANPTFITPSADGRFLYVANEQAGAGGGVTVGSVKLDTGEVTQIDHESGASVGMVFTSLDPVGRHVLAASYDGARVQVFPIEAGGGLGAAVDTLMFASGAQSHSVRVHAGGRFAFIPNKGLDSIAQCTYDATTGKLELNPAGAALSAPSGTGPRHIAFHPNQKWVYVANEVSSTLSAFSLNSNGTLAPIATKSTLPAGFGGSNTGAHVLVHPSGRAVYASNRGHDSIAVFALDADGSPRLLEHEPSRGQTPRNFDIDDAGEWLIAANEDSGSLAVFRIAADGQLDPVGAVVTGLTGPAAVAIVNVR
jgi:6-phosphogluconolactonase